MLREETPHFDSREQEMLDESSPNLDYLEELMGQATRAIFEGSYVSLILATIVLVNMAMIHGVSNAYMDELLKYLATVLLPQGNVLPFSHRDANRVIQKLGLNYEVIAYCLSGCIIYRNDMENMNHCPKCSKSRFI